MSTLNANVKDVLKLFDGTVVESLESYGKLVEVARKGDDTGVSPLFPKPIMREGRRVFRVNTGLMTY